MIWERAAEQEREQLAMAKEVMEMHTMYTSEQEKINENAKLAAAAHTTGAKERMVPLVPRWEPPKYEGEHTYEDDLLAASVDLLDEREQTHGTFAANALYGQKLRELFRESKGWKSASFEAREALEYIAGKMARILSGKPNEPQHWEDIAGYATLVVRAASSLPK